MRFDWFPYVLVAFAVIACGQTDPIEKPIPPDMSGLIEAYRNPTGELDADALNGVVTEITELLGDVDTAEELVAILEEIVDEALAPDPEQALTGVLATGGPDVQTAESVGTRRQGVTVQGDGFIAIRHICDGFGPDPDIDEDENGVIRLEATFSEQGVDPIVWGVLEQCKYMSGESELLLDGEANLHLGTLGALNLDQEEVAAAPILFELAMRVDVDSETLLDEGLDFRVCREAGDPASQDTDTQCLGAGVEIKVDLEDGTHVILFVDKDSTAGGVRASNVIWGCSFATDECTDSDGNTVPIPDLAIPDFDF